MKKALLVDGSPALAKLLSEAQRTRRAGVVLLERAQTLEAAIRAALPPIEDADGVRVAGQVVTRWRGGIRVEPDSPELAYQLLERRRANVSRLEYLDQMNDEQQHAGRIR